MIIQRWQAPLQLTLPQAHLIFESEGLDCYEEIYQPQEKVREHRHLFSEVRILLEGEMLFNISGNQFLLRAGDRVEIPANTRHSHTAQGQGRCLCLCAERII